MAKNIVICFDGTNNQFGSENTNVIRLAQSLNRNQKEQVVYYDPGVGTFPEPGFITKIGKQISEIFGLAFGFGLTRKIAQAYSFLMDHYDEGDTIYIFGFSRGSYTARSLAGVIFQFGLLPAGSYNLVPYLLRLSKKINKLDGSDEATSKEYWDISRGFRETFARTASANGSKVEYVRIHFLGLWDTVSSVGWIWDPTHFPYTTTCNAAVEIVRHAISIDERRWFFRQNRWGKPGNPSEQDVKEYWFPGVHCDIGGGYREKENNGQKSGRGVDKELTGLWQTSFIWMLLEAKKAGLLLDTAKAKQVLHKTRIQRPGWTNRKHESLIWKWWLAEFFPKIPRWRGVNFQWPRIGFFRCRTLVEGDLIHRSALRRLRRADLCYSPKNLSPEFRDFVLGIKILPQAVSYERSPAKLR